MMDNLPLVMLGSFVVAFSGAASPGPVLTITLSESVKRGFKVGPLIVLGHALLEVPVVVGVTLGLARFLQRREVSIGIAASGAVILFYLAWLTYRESRGPLMEDCVVRTGIKGWWDLPWKGILTSLSNPYWFLWWATIGLAYMTLAMKWGIRGVSAFYIGHISADLAWYSLVSALVASGRRFISEARYSWLLRICAVAFFFFGVYFAWRACAGMAGRAS